MRALAVGVAIGIAAAAPVAVAGSGDDPANVMRPCHSRSSQVPEKKPVQLGFAGGKSADAARRPPEARSLSFTSGYADSNQPPGDIDASRWGEREEPDATLEERAERERAEAARAFATGDCEGAVETWYDLALRGDVVAQAWLGTAYLEGSCGEPNLPFAAKWLERAAEGGDPRAMANFATLLLHGRGVERDEARAAALFREAAIRNVPAAQYALGELSWEGRLVRPDRIAAVRWWEEAAALGHEGAQFRLGMLHYRGESGFEKDRAEAARWFRRAAEHGHARSQYALGMQYRGGLGVDADPVRAWAWLELAAAAGHPEAAGRRDRIAERLDRGDRKRARRLARDLAEEIVRGRAARALGGDGGG